MTALEKLEIDIVELQHTAQLRMERNHRLKETGSEKYSEFKYGQSWGSYKSLSTILGIVRKIKADASTGVG